jgi:hypothetical protein
MDAVFADGAAVSIDAIAEALALQRGKPSPISRSAAWRALAAQRGVDGFAILLQVSVICFNAVHRHGWTWREEAIHTSFGKSAW